MASSPTSRFAMTRRFIVADTSVLLNFICAGEQDLLLKFVDDEQLHVPAVIRDEVERKLKAPRFQCGAQTWASLITHGHVHVLDDDMDRLFKYIRLFAGPRFSIQGGMAKNLGEYVAIAHCLAPLMRTLRCVLPSLSMTKTRKPSYASDRQQRPLAPKQYSSAVWSSVSLPTVDNPARCGRSSQDSMSSPHSRPLG